VFFVIALFGAITPQMIPAQSFLSSASVAPNLPSHPRTGCSADAGPSGQSPFCGEPRPLIVIGFMGGRIRAGNLAHKEAVIASDLDRRYPDAVDAITFANHRERDALRTVLRLLDTSRDGRLSQEEKNAARIVIYGHSWGGSETVNFARQLAQLGIPVLLTIQVDSIEKSGEDDRMIPPNVHEAINFYQTAGLLHGRSVIEAMDPRRTEILGNFLSEYKSKPVPCPGYSWYARAFMKTHIEIENDGALWNRIESLIVALSSAPQSRPSPSLPSAVASAEPVAAKK
jgi:pimeloyl-ACP methyl ester carboxylesterase